MKEFINSLSFVGALFSPLRPFRLRLYFGKIRIGVPIFYPRRWVRNKDRPGYLSPVRIKLWGFSYCGLGYKTKWSDTDYRMEWSPKYSLVVLYRQICLIVDAPHASEYWEIWLYYRNNTDRSKSKLERIAQCRKEFPKTYIRYNSDGTKQEIDYYDLVLRKRYINKIADI